MLVRANRGVCSDLKRRKKVQSYLRGRGVEKTMAWERGCVEVVSSFRGSQGRIESGGDRKNVAETGQNYQKKGGRESSSTASWKDPCLMIGTSDQAAIALVALRAHLEASPFSSHGLFPRTISVEELRFRIQ